MAENYVLLETIELTQSASSVTFDNIPQTGYTDLKIVVSARTTRSNQTDTLFLKFNNTATTYSNKRLYAFTGTVGSDTGSTGAGIDVATLNGATSTTNNFSNQEIYIGNYLSSEQKAVSYRGVSENGSSTGSFMVFNAGLWNGISAISTITLTPDVGILVSGSTFSLYGLAAVGTTPTVAPKAAGGNIVANDGTYWYHAFLSSGTFTPQTELSCDYLVVAGGGAAGYGLYSGGGGAGGYRTATAQSLTQVSYAVAVGAGGSVTSSRGTNGVNSSIIGGAISTTSTGGGGGGSYQTPANGLAGGSGGGGGSNTGTGGAGNAGSYSPVEGYAGGNGNSNGGAGGGGSSSAGTGSPSTTTMQAAGGSGTANSISGTSVTYAAGGKGSGDGGQAAVAGTAGTGNGGSATGTSANGGAGGSGIVIIRYAM